MKFSCERLICSLLFAIFTILGMGAIALQSEAQLSQPLPPLPQTKSDFSSQDNQSAYGNIFEKYGDSIVEVTLPDETGLGAGVGTGFLLAKEGRILHVVTPAHVIAGYETVPISVEFPDGSIYTGKVLGSDPTNDIALLQLRSNSTEDPFEPITLGNSSQVQVGEEVLVIGNPVLAGGQRTIPNLATKGIVGAAGVDIAPTADYPYPIKGAIVSDTAIAGGSSGSPLLNRRAKL